MKTGNKFLQKVFANKAITQVELSKVTGVTQQTLSKLASGVSNTPSRITALKLAKHFQVTTDEIYN